ncbi:MAG: acyl-CoA reductase [Verrucomicrobiia bacterium]
MTTGQVIAATARLWLKRGSPWMARAKRELTAFSPQMVELGLRELFADITANVEELERCETPCPTLHASRSTVCHILSGNLPNPGVVSIIVGLLSGARNVVKPATGDPMPALFMKSLAVVDSKLAKRVMLTADREQYRRVGVVVAYGNDETLAKLRRNVGGASVPRRNRRTKRSRGAEAPPTFFDFGHRVSIGVVDFLHSKIQNPKSKITTAAARDASMWDQQGCMSPQCFFVRGDAAAFAEALAEEMEAFDCRRPRAELSFEDAAAIARARNEWSFRGRVWASKGSTHWTVVLDERGGWVPSPLNRFVFVRPISLLAKLRHSKIQNPKSKISTVGFAGFSPKEAVAMAQADRYCSLGEMQRPLLLLTNGSRLRVGDLMI